LTTHYLEEADALCNRVAIVDRGRVVAEGTPARLKGSVAGDVVTLVVGDEARGVCELLESVVGVRNVACVDRAVRVTVDSGNGRALDLMRHVEGHGVTVASLKIAEPTLDDVFLALTGHSMTEAAAPEPLR
jgi:ABC-2 type transport system ATP-binding protein